jgi:hypothetical protein
MSEGLGGKQWPRVLGRQTQLGFSGTFSEGGDWGQNNDQPRGDGEPTGCESWINDRSCCETRNLQVILGAGL